MGFSNLLHPRTPIGLDVGTASVKAVQFVRAGRGHAVAACTRFPRATTDVPVSGEELSEIRAVLGRQGFVGAEVVAAATPQKLLSGALELPARAPGVPMEQIARAEFARIQKCDMAAAEFSWWELPAPARSGKATHVMAIAYPHAAAEAQLSLFDRAGFRLCGLDTQGSALGRTALAAADGVKTLAVLDLGWSGAMLVLMRDGMLAYERRIANGGVSRLHAAVQTRLQAEPGSIEQLIQQIGLGGETDAAEAPQVRSLIAAHFDAMIAEVQKACGYAQHQYPDTPTKLLVLAGGGACIPGAADHFRSAIGFDVRLADGMPAADPSVTPRQRPTPSHASAVGLAMLLN